MPTLRSLIDGTSISAAGIAPPMPAAMAAPPPGNAGQPKSKLPQPGGKGNKPAAGQSTNGKGSPMANHISNHMQDPLGATQEGFGKLTNAKLQYDQAREEMQRNLSPVQSVIDHVSQIHGIMPGAPAGQIPTPGMTPGQQQIDPMTGLPMGGQDPNNPGQNDDPDMQNGNPANMMQTPGQMNQNRPSMAGHQPGVSPGPSENVRPGKMGMPQPGGGLPQNNKQAAKPKGAGSLPGAKGPGDPKVGNKTKQAQGQSSRAIKINVAASSSSGLPVMHASRTIESTFGLATLMSAGTSTGAKKNWSTRNKGHLSKTEKAAHYKTMESQMIGGPARPVNIPRGGGGGMRPSAPRGGMPGGGMHRAMLSGKKMKAGPAQLQDKVSDSGAELSYNPTGTTGLNACASCGKMHAKHLDCSMFA